ncbi:coiled-coil domain-containing protein [Streptomyces millisiae]|uniref:NlpC/P60 domain-containing protein n=1 Tax=Streptomyces millisiae TaxID=3075542 RepID=A0ABU2LQZ2_9ACTN|nr:hypothetical protein [Streptomyces sp. DSM 44918]MDT0319468.1 hypothetical protein [Streptomyces sp. DSM 44918]
MTRQRRWAAAALAVLALTAVPVRPAAAERSPQEELRALYRETGEATRAHEEAVARLAERRDEARRLEERLAATRSDLAAAREAAGRVARAQYRGGLQLPPALALLLGEDPGQALHDQTVAARAAAARAAEIDRLDSGERAADELATAARAALDAELAAAEEERRRRDDLHRRLDELAALTAGLTPEELAELTPPQTPEPTGGAGQAAGG